MIPINTIVNIGYKAMACFLENYEVIKCLGILKEPKE